MDIIVAVAMGLVELIVKYHQMEVQALMLVQIINV
jgi:hypothetical protein